MIFILSYDIILDFNSNGQKKVFKSKYKSKELNMVIYRDLEGQTESGPFLKMEPEAKSRGNRCNFARVFSWWSHRGCALFPKQ